MNNIINEINILFKGLSELPWYTRKIIEIELRIKSCLRLLENGILSFITIEIFIVFTKFSKIDLSRMMTIFRAIERKYKIKVSEDKIENLKEAYIYLSILLKRIFQSRKSSKYQFKIKES